MLTTATPAGADARLEQIARLNDRTRLGLDRSARVVITRNCLERLAEARARPRKPSCCKPA
jgi:ribosomal protein L15E